MTTPALAASRFAAACLLGLGLGLWYEFLRPLRPRHTNLSDLLFLPGAFWAWLYLSFGVCGGDLRLGYCAGLFVGAWVFRLLPGRLLAPVFRSFWKIPAAILSGLRFILKKIKNFVKLLFSR